MQWLRDSQPLDLYDRVKFERCSGEAAGEIDVAVASEGVSFGGRECLSLMYGLFLLFWFCV